MKERYPFLISEKVLHLEFKFESVGPKGTIKKVARYNLQNDGNQTFFELMLGDRTNKTKDFDIEVVSDNKDRDKILTTVAATIVEFTKNFPDLAIIATGNTSAKTRLYQMLISTNLDTIKTTFNVYGSCKGTWEPFKKNVKYDAFAVQRKR